MSVEVIAGPMFCGKSEELHRRLKRARIAEQQFAVFSHVINSRDTDGYVSTRDGQKLEARTVESALEMAETIDIYDPTPDVIAVEEVQFFDKDIVQVVEWLRDCKNTRVIVAGLDLDFRRQPFGSMPELLAIADKVTKLEAICAKCKNEHGRYTQRLVNGEPASWKDPIVLIGDVEEGYEVRCHGCYEIKDAPEGLIYASANLVQNSLRGRDIQ